MSGEPVLSRDTSIWDRIRLAADGLSRPPAQREQAPRGNDETHRRVVEVIRARQAADEVTRHPTVPLPPQAETAAPLSSRERRLADRLGRDSFVPRFSTVAEHVTRGVMGSAWYDSLPSAAATARAALEWLSPAGDMVDAYQAGQNFSRAARESDVGGIVSNTGYTLLGLAGTMLPGRPAAGMRAVFAPDKGGGSGSSVARARSGRSIPLTGLPMDETSRMARAKEMGFSEEAFYRGEASGRLPSHFSGAAFFSRDPETAGGFAARGGGNAVEYRLRMQRPLVFAGPVTLGDWADIVVAVARTQGAAVAQRVVDAAPWTGHGTSVVSFQRRDVAAISS